MLELKTIRVSQSAKSLGDIPYYDLVVVLFWLLVAGFGGHYPSFNCLVHVTAF